MKITEYIKNNITLLDGGMGTLLQEAGLNPGELPERWNISHKDIVSSIHKRYYDAGSNVVSMNTFGANSLKFDDAELRELIYAAFDNVRTARDLSAGAQEKFIALDIGPSGKLLKPYGDLDFEDAVALFAKTIEIGTAAGADLIFIETMNDSYETKAALLAAKENSDLPVFVSNAYGADGKLMTGANAEAMVAMLEGMGADAIGVNCSLGPDALMPVIEDYLKFASVPVLFKPNAGLPKMIDGRTVYDIEADDFALSVGTALEKGVRIAGGCCGTTPEYIASLKVKIPEIDLVPISDKERSVISSYTHAVSFGNVPVLIGERINPTGKKRLKAALIEKDTDYILGQGFSQQEAGADVLDVNVGLPEIDEKSELVRIVSELQAVLDLPLQIDTSDTNAMEAAVRRYNGKPMINSVNGKAENMAAIFPIVKKYGGIVVALLLDEDGIPDTPAKRVDVAKKIIRTAAEYGIATKDLIFDPLAMAVSAAPDAAITTLEVVGLLSNMGCHTSLGLSNISFGLPNRGMINGTFYAMALENGLSAAIMNPASSEMMQTYYSFKALKKMDENCTQYIDYATKHQMVKQAPVSAPLEENSDGTPNADAEISALQNAVIKGLKEQTRALTRKSLLSVAPLDIISGEIIPALDKVGAGYEKGTVYLPQLLISAEAAKCAFDEIKSAFPKSSAEKCPFVIATVHGDIHDIGKNIVKLLFENYGFDVIDLGRDVPPETVVEAVLEHHAPVAGLSALMTTTVPAMEETIKQLREKAPFCKVVVGGAVMTAEYAAKIGADKYAADAMETVRYADLINDGLKN